MKTEISCVVAHQHSLKHDSRDSTRVLVMKQELHQAFTSSASTPGPTTTAQAIYHIISLVQYIRMCVLVLERDI